MLFTICYKEGTLQHISPVWTYSTREWKALAWDGACSLPLGGTGSSFFLLVVWVWKTPGYT